MREVNDNEVEKNKFKSKSIWVCKIEMKLTQHKKMNTIKIVDFFHEVIRLR